MNITQDFEVKMYVTEHGQPDVPVAFELCKAITGWSVEALDDEDDEEEDGFLVPESDGDEDVEDGDEADEEPAPEKLLVIRSTLHKKAIEDFRELIEVVQPLKIQFIYGSDEAGQVIKVFESDTNSVLSMLNSGSRGAGAADTPLEVELLFDVYSSDTLY